MPIVEHDPWRDQYFAGVACPDGVVIPTDDADAYDLYPRYRWVYNKLLIAESQSIGAKPHGMLPPAFPIFSKPIYNMRGMGTGSCVIRSLAQWQRRQAPGHMWMELLTGEHVSSDVAIIDGEPAWWRHATGLPLKGGTFDYWIVHAELRPALEEYCGNWLRRNLKGYTGMANFETIGGRIIECHLRFSDQWPDLYGPGWVDALVALYETGAWEFADDDRSEGYSVVLFAPYGRRYRHPPAALIEEVKAIAGITSVQITFHDDQPPEAHAMPPGGFRLAIVNCWDLDAGFDLRDRLALRFWSTGHARVPRGRRAASGAAAG